jgi:hypothetical protein
MAKKVWKYKFEDHKELTIKLPHCSIVVAAAIQTAAATIWVEISDSTCTVSKTFKAFGTNDEIPNSATHCKTIMDSGHVWHIYELSNY